MHIDRLYPLETSAHGDMDQINRSNSGSLSESDECRKPAATVDKKDREFKKKHRRGKKRNKPKWKPYTKMTQEERRRWDVYEESRIAKKEAELAVKSRRPVAPFNTTQFLMEDRTDSQVYKPHPSEISRCVSFDSSTSGGIANHIKMVNPILSLSPPVSEILSLSFSFLCSPLHLGEDAYELEDDALQEQEAFLEADFNQVYTQLRMDRLEGMTKQDLIKECFTLEDRVATIQQERIELLKEVQKLQDLNQKLSEDKNNILTSETVPLSATS